MSTCLQKAEASQISLHSQVLRQALNGGLGALWFQNTESWAREVMFRMFHKVILILENNKLNY